MKSDSLRLFILSYILLVLAIFIAFLDYLMICGLLVGLSVFFRSMATTISLPSAISLIQEKPVWKWFTVVYLFILMAWLIQNIDSDFLDQLNPLVATFFLFFPFIIPYILKEFDTYKSFRKNR